MSQIHKGKKIRVGVVGASRGNVFAKQSSHVGMELVAMCDSWEEKLRNVAQAHGVAAYTDYDKFLQHDMDAVILANYFHQHAPFAVKAFEAGFHVMSECAACHTLGEGVALARAFEKSGKIYMFAENYPYMRFNQEMRRLYQAGTIGEFQYGEGEYVHPGSIKWALSISPGMNHWRNWIPSTYYCTHSVAPVMFITDTHPTMVNGFIVPRDLAQESKRYSVHRGDIAAVLMLRMNNGAVVKALKGSLKGHQVFVRIHGQLGMMENLRVGDRSQIRLSLEPHRVEEGKVEEKIYLPDWPEHGVNAEAAGHGGGDFFVMHHFAEAIRTGEQPYLNVYRAIDMSIVGILAYRSALQDGAPMEVPDFRNEEVRKQFEDDDWTPDPERRKPGQPYSSVLGNVEPTPEAIALAREVWESIGYRGE